MVLALICFSISACAQQENWVSAGDRALDQGQPAAASENYQRGIDALVRSGAPPLEIFQVQINLATAYLEAKNYHHAEVALRDAEGTAQKLPGGAERVELFNGRGSLYLLLGKLPSAESEFRHASDLLDRQPEPGADLAMVLHNLSAIEMRTGRYQESYADSQHAVDLWLKKLGPGNPLLVKAWANLGAAQYLILRPEDSAISLQRAIELADKTYGPDYPLMPDLLESQAFILDRLKRKGEARQARSRAKILQRAYASSEAGAMTFDVRERLVLPGGVRLVSK